MGSRMGSSMSPSHGLNAAFKKPGMRVLSDLFTAVLKNCMVKVQTTLVAGP